MTTPTSRRLVDPQSGREVEVLYALPYDLLGASAPSAESGLAPAELLACLWAGRWRIAAVSGVAAVLAAVLALLTPNEYSALVNALPPGEKSGGKMGQYADLAAMAGVAIPGANSGSVEETLAILDSRTLKERLVARFALKEYYSAQFDEDAIKAFDVNFSARHDKKTNRVTISVTHRIPTQAAEIANAAAAELQTIFNQIHQSSSKRERAFLEGRLAEADKDMAAAQAKLAEFQRTHHTIEIESQAKATVEAVSRLQGELIAQQIELRALLGSQVNADNPNVILLQQRIGEMTKAINDLAGSGKLEGGGVFLGLGTLPELSITYLGLYREVKKNEAILTRLIVQVETARISEIRDSEVITIVDSARVPERKSGPKRAMMTIAGLMLGLLASAGWVLVRGRHSFASKASRPVGMDSPLPHPAP